MRPYQAFHALETLRNNSLVALRRKGVPLSRNDSQTTLDVYQQWLLLAMDLGYLSPETLSQSSTRLWNDLLHADVLELNNAFAECLHSVRMQIDKGFKALCRKVSVHLFNIVKDDFSRCLLGDTYAAGRLIQLFSYTSRLSLRDIDLTPQLLQEYRDIDAGIPVDVDDTLVLPLNRIVRRWLGSFAPPSIAPRHGPGGTAGLGRCSLETKYLDLTSDKRLTYAFGDPDWVVSAISSHCDRISETIFVPKSFKTFRTISMEPTTLQYFQQGVWRAIDGLVQRSGYLRNRIGFHDQTRNQHLARVGSIERSYATIDLSAASDSVGYDLVKKLFRGTWLPRFILATRSTRTKLPDGDILTLKKFAPMGSALCFPVETILFASICEKVTRDHRVSGDYSVFGDDIIVPTQCVEDLMRYLEALGFRVNREKSFYLSDCWFRESCGGEYCDGFDVTPMRVSRQYSHQVRRDQFTSLIDLANSAYTRGFFNLRYFFIAMLKKHDISPLFGPHQLLSDNYSNYQTKKRWNTALQRIEIRAHALVSKAPLEDHSDLRESIRYRHWFESTNDRIAIGDGFESVICKPTVDLKLTWQSKPYELLDQQFIDSCLTRADSRTMNVKGVGIGSAST